MNVSPFDLGQQKFKRKLWGYAPTEVHSCLDLVTAELSRLSRDRASSSNELEETKSRIEEYREREKGLRETMLAAQRVTEEMKTQAQKHADLVIARAEISAEHLLEEAQKRHALLLVEIAELKRHKIRCVLEMKNLLETHLSMLSLEERPTEEVAQSSNPERERVEV